MYISPELVSPASVAYQERQQLRDLERRRVVRESIAARTAEDVDPRIVWRTGLVERIMLRVRSARASAVAAKTEQQRAGTSGGAPRTAGAPGSARLAAHR